MTAGGPGSSPPNRHGPPNAIVHSSGMLPITRMVKSGAVFDVIGAVLCVVGVAVMARVVGLV